MADTIVTTHWRASDVAGIADTQFPETAVITAKDTARVLPGFDLWDMWPVTLSDGSTADFSGTSLWVILSAPKGEHPDQRHDIARLRLLARTGGAWIDRGPLLPVGFSPGSREWAGSTIFDPDHALLTLYYTATGRRENPASFEQRMFQTSCKMAGTVPGPWSPPVELFASDGDHYVDTRLTGGGAGLIKGFRDPGYFRDPRDGREFLTFTGSDGRSSHSHNGVIGLAERVGDNWIVHPPVISGDGVNNEFERPHIICRDGCYYLFWSTQRHTFAPDGPSGPNGLYGMVADCVEGPYRPLNGTGLVAANPVAEPTQTYSWLVLGSLEVVSFIDLWDMRGRTRQEQPDLAISQFGGTPAPWFRLALDRDRTRIV